MGLVAWFWQPATQRMVRRVRRSLWVVLALWFAWYAYVRWTTLPAAMSKPDAAAATAVRPSRESLHAALLAVPTFSAPLPQTLPGGYWGGKPWSSEALEEALAGEWSNDDPELPRVKAFLSPTNHALRAALDDLARLCARDFALFRQAPFDRGSSNFMPWNEYPRGITMLLLRARYRINEESDLPGAVADLATALRLMDLYQATDYSGNSDSADVLVRLVETPLPRPLAQELIHVLRDELGIALGANLRATFFAEMDVEGFLDRFYTCDRRGDGWLVLSHSFGDTNGSPFDGQGVIRSGFWNLFAPLYYRRAEVRTQLTQQYALLDVLDHMVWSEIEAQLSTLGLGREDPSQILAGPAGMLTMQMRADGVRSLHNALCERRALLVMIALSAYRHDHGEYPLTLGALVPDYLDEVPIDLNAQAPFEYTLDSDARYDLRSRAPRLSGVSSWELTQHRRDDPNDLPRSYVPRQRSAADE